MKSAAIQPEIITRKGKPVSVILPIKAYNDLIERLEDRDDAVAMKHARRKPQQFRPFKEYLAEQSKRRV